MEHTTGSPEGDDEAGIPEAGAAAAGRRRPRALLMSVTALAAVAVLTLATVTRSPSVKAGADPEPSVSAPASTGSPALTDPASKAPPTTAPAPPATPAAPSRTPAVTTWRSVGRAVEAAVAGPAGSGTGDFAVGVTEVDGTAVATYDSGAGDDEFDTASIVKVDILAALLLNAQTRGTSLTAEQRGLATAMIEWSDNDAALALWNTLGRAPGLEAANAALGLGHTSGGPGELWGLTRTTAGDQLALLRAVFAGSGDSSPLSAASRAYIVDLMRSVIAEQRWGVSAADSGAGSGGYALKNGWLRRTATGLWDINSIGEVAYRGHRLLICVLSSGQPTRTTGVELVENAAVAAAKAFTAALAPASEQ
jgi:hypothetical protein